MISSSILGTYHPQEFIFQCLIFLPFHTVHGVLKARILSGLPFPSPVGHILSELSTMTHPSWVGPWKESAHHLNWSQVSLLQRPFTFWDLPSSTPCLPGGLPSLLGSEEAAEAPYSEVLASFHPWAMFGQSGFL